MMQQYLKAVYLRLHKEVGTSKVSTVNWLINMITKYEWWIQTYRSEWVCNQLGSLHNKNSYYRSIYV
jgi:hypothetical protein